MVKSLKCRLKSVLKFMVNIMDKSLKYKYNGQICLKAYDTYYGQILYIYRIRSNLP